MSGMIGWMVENAFEALARDALAVKEASLYGRSLKVIFASIGCVFWSIVGSHLSSAGWLCCNQYVAKLSHSNAWLIAFNLFVVLYDFRNCISRGVKILLLDHHGRSLFWCLLMILLVFDRPGKSKLPAWSILLCCGFYAFFSSAFSSKSALLNLKYLTMACVSLFEWPRLSFAHLFLTSSLLPQAFWLAFFEAYYSKCFPQRKIYLSQDSACSDHAFATNRS